MPRFLHTADWQIGRQYASFARDDAVTLAEARLTAVELIARLATGHAVDAVLVAGDVFDAQTISEKTVRRMFNAMAGYAGPWIMIPGNHDAALTESIWTFAQRLNALPSNLHLALVNRIFEFPEAGFAVLCAPLTQRQTHHDLTSWFDDAQTSAALVRVGIAHGSVQGILAEDIDSSNPIAADRASSACLDYLALGDWHGCKQIDSRTWYSGTPEPDRFKNNSPGFALLVDVPAPGAEPVVTQLATASYIWKTWEHRIDVPSDADEVIARLDAVGSNEVLQCRVSGRTDLAGMQRIRSAVSRAEAKARSIAVDLASLRLLPTAEDIAALKAEGYLGEVIAELRDRQIDAAGSEQADIAVHALGLLTTILAGRQAGRP